MSLGPWHALVERLNALLYLRRVVPPLYETCAVRTRVYADHTIENVLQEYSAYGWRLIAVAPYGVVDEGQSRTVHVLYFERRAPKQP